MGIIMLDELTCGWKPAKHLVEASGLNYFRLSAQTIISP